MESPGDYRWSSYRLNGLGRTAAYWTPHPLYVALGKTPVERAAAYRKLFRGQIDEEILAEIRRTANQGVALGNRFKVEIESLSGRRVVQLKRGPESNSAG